MKYISSKSLYTQSIYNAVYSPPARRIGKLIRDRALGAVANIGQNCILSRKDIDRLAKLCALSKNKRVLDLCCGDGGVDIYLARKFGCQITGVDFSDAGVRTAQNLSKQANVVRQCRFQLGWVENISFPECSFDVILSLDSFIHVRNKVALLKRCFKFLKSGGILIFSDWIRRKNLSKKIQWSGKLWGYIYLSNVDAYKRLLFKAGFDNITMQNNSAHFKKMIAKWDRVNWRYREFLVKECGKDYFLRAKQRWGLAKKLSKEGSLGQSFFICQKA